MGLLTVGTPLSWEETKKQADHVRKHGIIQFLAQYRKLQDRASDDLYWGDEVEYMIIKFDDVNKKVYVSMRSAEVLAALHEKAKHKPKGSVPTAWHWEYANYMIEGTPGRPYGGNTCPFGSVERNMEKRRKEVEDELQPGEAILSLTVFPRLGCGNFTWPPVQADIMNEVTRSRFFPDLAICQGHVRFRTFSRNICKRRNKRVTINIPIFKDIKTPSPFLEDFSSLGDEGENVNEALPDHIYMDCVGFGMGNCCLQVTFQACGLEEAQILYDQMAPLCPLMLALSAASPIYKGYLADIDCRWLVISQSVDDRTDEEKGLKPLKNDRFHIRKSRYDSINSYLSATGKCYNDVDLVYDQDICDDLLNAGVDDLLAQHIAHLFIRDPISLLQEKLHINDEEDTDHFENIQTTNWQTLRFKLPPPNSNIGWRVEFRPMDTQLTDFENAAYTTFILLMTRVILTYKLNLLIPISKVDENMKTSFKKDSVLKGKFYFRKDVLAEYAQLQRASHNSGCPENCATHCSDSDSDSEPEYELMTIDEIFNGKDDFPGLISLIDLYIKSSEMDVDTRCNISQYLTFISERASGKVPTCAHWIREFVMQHPDYRQDSVVSDSIAYDLLKRMTEMSSSNSKVDETSPFTQYSTTNSSDLNMSAAKAED